MEPVVSKENTISLTPDIPVESVSVAGLGFLLGDGSVSSSFVSLPFAASLFSSAFHG